MTKIAGATLALSAAFMAVSSAEAAPIHQVVTVNGVKADRYTWKDSQNRNRSVSLKREGNGNPGHGGYAVQMTYQVRIGGAWRTITVNAAGGNDGGFGYFVSHERFRDFADGANDTIAGKIFSADDSPLGLRFPVVGRKVVLPNPTAVAHRFTFEYPRYGTIDPIPKGADGNDKRPTPVGPGKFELYKLPVTVTWIFQDRYDYPRILTEVSLANVPGPDRVNFDLRGPYGVMVFDNGANRVIDQVIWGDRFHFRSLGGPLTRNSAWHWQQPNRGALHGVDCWWLRDGPYRTEDLCVQQLGRRLFGRARKNVRHLQQRPRLPLPGSIDPMRLGMAVSVGAIQPSLRRSGWNDQFQENRLGLGAVLGHRAESAGGL
jgi:hypothetical protein